MSEATKPVRLSKVAKEFNIGVTTICEFLEKKGIEVENSPNAKIDQSVYDMIRDEFADEKTLKEKAKRAVRPLERESITLESNKKVKEDPEEDEDELDLSSFQNTVSASGVTTPAKEASKPAEKPAPAPAPVPPTPPVAPEPPKVEAAPVPEARPEPEVEAPAEEGPRTSPKVIGHVDLDALNPRKKAAQAERDVQAKANASKAAADKAAADRASELAAQKAAAEKAAAEKAAAEKAAAEQAAAEKKAAAEAKAAEPPQVMRAEAEKLQGLTVVGRIELPVERAKKKHPVASSSDNDSKKRKRKRISNEPAPAPPKPAGTREPGQGISRLQRGPARGKQAQQNDKKQEVSDADIQKEIKETLARLSGGGKSKSSKLRRAKRDMVAARHEEEEIRRQEESTVLKLTEFVTVSELTRMMNAAVNDVISACMSLGIMVSINQRLDAETIQIIAEEFGYEAEFVSAEVQEAITEEADDPSALITRPPIVTVMGHVDHGKTSLLDYIRKANVIAGEAGGITQHIGAYNVMIGNGKTMTFLDTPGHEAFTAMRARGAQVTDLAIIVISADDAVMPQTKEAINHAQAAGIPMVFAINKIDRPDANPEKIREQLANMNILVEDWGGKYQCQEISAKQGLNIEELLEKVLLEAEILELKANPKRRALGTIIESALDKGRGYVCTLLVENGTLRVGDAMLAGQFSGRVKAMYNERGQRVEEAGPAMPVSMLGMSGAPSAGDKFHVFEDEREARAIATKRQQLQREQGVRTQRHITIEEIGRRIAIGEFKELNLIVKGDVDGSIEALSDALQKLSTEKIQVNIIHKAVGQISESDVMLASASDAIIIGFQVRPSAGARKLAENEEIQIRLYSVIYQAIDEMREAMEGMLAARIEERVVGTAEIREAFKISKVGTIAGCFVLDGKITRNNKVRIIRDGIVIYTGDLGSLKRFKDDVKEVTKGYECGLNIDNFNYIKEVDQIEAFELVEVKQTLND